MNFGAPPMPLCLQAILMLFTDTKKIGEGIGKGL